MLIQDDWFMRQIELLVAALARLLLGKDVSGSSAVSPEEGAQENGELLLSLSEKGQICAAEDLLFEHLDSSDPTWSLAGIRFYEHLASLSDEELARGGFSREEILQGLEDLCSICGYPELASLIGR